MNFCSLLLCDELSTLNVMCKTLDDARMEREICTDPEQAKTLIESKKFEAVIVDCDEMEGAHDLMRRLRRAALNRNAIVFAIINGHTSVNNAFELGANFVLDKPLSPELLLRSLRAAQGFMLREQRRFYRHPVDLLVAVSCEKKPTVHYTAHNLSEGGMNLTEVKKLALHDEVNVSFQLPGGQTTIEGSAEVVWVHSERGCGLRFIKLSYQARAALKNWLSEKFDQQTPLMFINAVGKG